MQWNANLYTNHASFVYQYGENVIDWLNPQENEAILDLGCGTGQLTKMIAERGAEVVGIDSSKEMINEARSVFPTVDFRVEDAQNVKLNQPFDAVFSNAALHWMLDAEAVIKNVYDALKDHGRFVAEFGEKRNIQTIRRAIDQALNEMGYSIASCWYFPSVGEYATLLEKYQFKIGMISSFERPTYIGKGDQAMKNWLENFAQYYLQQLSINDKETCIYRVIELVRQEFEREEGWYADYHRLRFVAMK